MKVGEFWNSVVILSGLVVGLKELGGEIQVSELNKSYNNLY